MSSPPTTPRYNFRKKPGLTPLLEYVENIESEIHQNPSEAKVKTFIKKNFSKDFQVEENGTALNLAGFITFNRTFRKQFLVLDITDRRPVVHKSDPDGKGGVVGFATSWVFKQKSDGKLVGGDTIEIFTVTWVPGHNEKMTGHRQITNAQAAIGDLKPVRWEA